MTSKRSRSSSLLDADEGARAEDEVRQRAVRGHDHRATDRDHVGRRLAVAAGARVQHARELAGRIVAHERARLDAEACAARAPGGGRARALRPRTTTSTARRFPPSSLPGNPKVSGVELVMALLQLLLGPLAPVPEPAGHLVARVPEGKTVVVRNRPGGRVVARLPARTEFGSPQTLAVLERKDRLARRLHHLASQRTAGLDRSLVGAPALPAHAARAPRRPLAARALGRLGRPRGPPDERDRRRPRPRRRRSAASPSPTSSAAPTSAPTTAAASS